MENSIFEKVFRMFKKEEKIPCIIFDGKKMNYRSLTKKEIEDIQTKPEFKDWNVTIDEENIFAKKR